MLEVTCCVDCTIGGKNERFSVQSFWPGNNRIKLQIDNKEYIVGAADLRMAIANATNH